MNVGTQDLVVKPKLKRTKPISTRNSENIYNKYKELMTTKVRGMKCYF